MMAIRASMLFAVLAAAFATSAQNKKELQVAFAYSLDSMAQIQDQLGKEICLSHERIAEMRGALGDRERELEGAQQKVRMLQSSADSLSAVRRVDAVRSRIYLPSTNVTDGRGYRHERIVMARFSDLALPDTFKVVAQGPDLLGAVITFSVVNGHGRLIYRTDVEPLGANDVLATEELQRCTIQRKLQTFFIEPAFNSPAFSPELARWHGQPVVGANSSTTAQTVQGVPVDDPLSLSFTFFSGEGQGHTIAFNKASGQVVDIAR